MRKNIRLNLNRSVAVMIALLVAFTFCGCDIPSKEASGLKVVTVSYVQYDFVKKICGDNAEVTMLSKPGGDIHGFEPSLADIKKISKADVFVYNGGESDGWIEKILKSIDDLPKRCVKLCDSVKLLCNHHGHEEHESGHGGHHHFDEHIQSSPKNAVLMIDAICEAVSEEDSSNREIYEANAKAYISEIKKLDAELEQLAEGAERKRLIVADKFPFLYLTEHYGFEYDALFSGCSQENDANPSVMIHMIEEIKTNNIDTVFYTELSDGKMADTICGETGAIKLMLHSCEGISREDFENEISYAQLMQQNILNLREALL